MNQDDEVLPITPDVLARMRDDMRKRGLVSSAMDHTDQLEKRRPGRPAGSGEQLAPAERSRQSRQSRAAQGATRLDFFLDPPQAGQLAELMEQWDMATRKEVVQHALDIVYQTVAKNRKAPA